MATLVLHNGIIHTLNKDRPTVNSLVISNGVVTYIGNDISTNLREYSNAKIIDLSGRTIVPGLRDAHAHMKSFGKTDLQANLTEAQSLEQVAEIIREYAQKASKGEWILGRGWNHERWNDRSLPTHERLSKAAPDNPVFLTRVDGHAGLANDYALKFAKIDSHTKSPYGGLIVLGNDGPTGILVDTAMKLINDHIPEPSLDETKSILITAQERCISAGLVEIHDAGISETELAAYRAMAQEGSLKIRIYAMLKRDFFETTTMTPFKIGNLSCRSVKIVSDGALGSRGAAMLEPYSDVKEESGFMLLRNERFRTVTSKAFAEGFQVNVHAIGDKANRITLDIIESCLKETPILDHRSRIEHAQIVSLQDIPRFKTLGIIASVQQTHCTSDMNMAEARLGAERMKGAYPWRKFINAGVVIAGGSDFPVENHNPLWGIYSAVTRQDHEGNPPGGWYSDERMTINEALRSFTLGPAYASFEETNYGPLSPGKAADLVILDRDILKDDPNQLLKTNVLATLINGKVVFSTMPELECIT